MKLQLRLHWAFGNYDLNHDASDDTIPHEVKYVKLRQLESAWSFYAIYSFVSYLPYSSNLLSSF